MNYYKVYTEQLLPPYFLGAATSGYFTTSGYMKDQVNSAAQDAVQDSFIQSAPDDALLNIGDNFNIDKATPLSDVVYKAKLEEHWTYWQTSGTPARLITEIKTYGFTNVSILPEWIESPPGTWTKSLPITDPQPEMDLPNDNSFGGTPPAVTGIGWWSNFWVIINQPHSYTPILWGSVNAGNWGTGGPFGPYNWGGVGGDQDTLIALKALIRKLKPAWTSCRGIIFALAGWAAWGLFNWNDGTLWGAPTGSYMVYYIREDWES